MQNLNNHLVSESCLRYFAIDLQMSFVALAIVSKKSKTISETCAKLSQFGAISETQGLAGIVDNSSFFLLSPDSTNNNLHNPLPMKKPFSKQS